ncbi:MAG: hypothetical protein ACP5N1_00525 [Candidatus Woesearchaeota archaeon]
MSILSWFVKSNNRKNTFYGSDSNIIGNYDALLRNLNELLFIAKNSKNAITRVKNLLATISYVYDNLSGLEKSGITKYSNMRPYLDELSNILSKEYSEYELYSKKNSNYIIKKPEPSSFNTSVKTEKTINELIYKIVLLRDSKSDADYIEALGDTDYFYKILSDNYLRMNSEKLFNRLKFSKTGSVLIPLGGLFKGKYLVRIISLFAFEAWKLAFESGISTEELIKNPRTGKYRIIVFPNDKVAVMTKYAGQSLAKYSVSSNKDTIDMVRQQSYIISQLDKLHIVHGHTHLSNFCVLYENGKPHVRIIDFDKAYIKR